MSRTKLRKIENKKVSVTVRISPDTNLPRRGTSHLGYQSRAWCARRLWSESTRSPPHCCPRRTLKMLTKLSIKTMGAHFLVTCHNSNLNFFELQY